MSLEYSTLDELSSLISDTVVGHMIIRILELYGSFGPVPGIVLPFIEAFLPLLPIIVFILANIVYGLFWIYIFVDRCSSWSDFIIYFSTEDGTI